MPDCWMSVWGLGTSAQMSDCILMYIRRYLHNCQNLPYIMSQLCDLTILADLPDPHPSPKHSPVELQVHWEGPS